MNPQPLPDRVPAADDAIFVLRRLREADLESLVAYRSDPAVAQYQSWPLGWGSDDARRLFEADREMTHVTPGEWTQLIVEESASGVVCGDVGVHFVADQPNTVEIGVTLAPEYRGRGAATASLNTLLAWLFEGIETHRVFAHVDERNRPARRVLDRLGFRHEATLVEADWFKDEWTTLCIYAMLRREWAATPPSWPGRSRHA